MKRLLGAAVDVVALVLVWPLYLLLLVLERVQPTDEPFQLCSQLLSLAPGVPGNMLRARFYRLTLTACADDVRIEFGTTLNQRGIEIGRRVYVGSNCCIGLCRIEDDVLIGSNVDIISGRTQHGVEDLDRPMRQQAGTLSKISIGEDAWLGNSAVILADVGKKAIVAAGAVVVKAVGPFDVVGGNPARILKSRLSTPVER